MTLSEAFRQITMFPADGIIFAERIRGVFRPESPCVVLTLSDEQLQLPTSRVAEELAPGFEYFLEVHIVLDLRKCVDITSIRRCFGSPDLLRGERCMIEAMRPNKSFKPNPLRGSA